MRNRRIEVYSKSNIHLLQPVSFARACDHEAIQNTIFWPWLGTIAADCRGA